jgi:ferredoxin
MRNFRYLQQVATLDLDIAHCIGCGLCEDVCPHGVFQVIQQRAKIVDLNACIECGACARNCPVGVITVNSGVGCASGLLVEWWQERFPGRNSGGCC